MRVLQSFPAPRPTTNPYLVQLRDALQDQAGVEVLTFSWRGALTGGYDLVHVHWPELLVRGRGRLRTAARRALYAALLARSAWRRTPIVRTLHNPVAHEPGPWAEQRLLSLLDRRTRLWIRLNDRTPAPRNGITVTIPLGDYVDWFSTYERPPTVRGTVLLFGLLRPYKGLDGLIDAFTGTTDGTLRLRLVGRPSTADVQATVERAIATDTRVSARLEYVTDADLAAEVGRAELVVLPHRDMHNSSALMLALSLRRPVLVPGTPVTEDLAAEVGGGWVTTYDGRLTARHIEDAIAGGRARADVPEPDLRRRNWATIGTAHRAAYEEALRSATSRSS